MFMSDSDMYYLSFFKLFLSGFGITTVQDHYGFPLSLCDLEDVL